MLNSHIAKVMTHTTYVYIPAAYLAIMQRVIKGQRVLTSTIFEHDKGALQTLMWARLLDPLSSREIISKNYFIVKPYKNSMKEGW